MSKFDDLSIKTVWLATALAVVAILGLCVILGLKARTANAPAAVTEGAANTDAAPKETAAEKAKAAAPPVRTDLKLAGTLRLSSSDIALIKSRNPKLPLKYTCLRDNISPPLVWTGVNSKTKSFVILFQKIEQGKPPHNNWVIFNIGNKTSSLAAQMPKTPLLDNGMVQARNDFGNNEYAGPCGREDRHQYVFRLFALDTVLKPDPAMGLAQLGAAMRGHIVDIAELPVLYAPPR